MKIHVSKKLPVILGVLILLLLGVVSVGVITSNAQEADSVTVSKTDAQALEGRGLKEDDTVVAVVADDTSSATGTKAIAAALAVGLAAAAGAFAMGMAISKSAEGISRQPEAEGSIRTSLMLGLVFIETAIIYALIVAILIIFVM